MQKEYSPAIKISQLDFDVLAGNKKILERDDFVNVMRDQLEMYILARLSSTSEFWDENPQKFNSIGPLKHLLVHQISMRKHIQQIIAVMNDHRDSVPRHQPISTDSSPIVDSSSYSSSIPSGVGVKVLSAETTGSGVLQSAADLTMNCSAHAVASKALNHASPKVSVSQKDSDIAVCALPILSISAADQSVLLVSNEVSDQNQNTVSSAVCLEKAQETVIARQLPQADDVELQIFPQGSDVQLNLGKSDLSYSSKHDADHGPHPIFETQRESGMCSEKLPAAVSNSHLPIKINRPRSPASQAVFPGIEMEQMGSNKLFEEQRHNISCCSCPPYIPSTGSPGAKSDRHRSSRSRGGRKPGGQGNSRQRNNMTMPVETTCGQSDVVLVTATRNVPDRTTRGVARDWLARASLVPDRMEAGALNHNGLYKATLP